MSIYESPSTAEGLARYLATYITDDSAIIGHVKHRFGVRYNAKDIAKFRASLPQKYTSKALSLEGEVALANVYRPYRGTIDPLAMAITKHHPQIVRNLKNQHFAKYGRYAR